jgi:hypothetical protein
MRISIFLSGLWNIRYIEGHVGRLEGKREKRIRKVTLEKN